MNKEVQEFIGLRRFGVVGVSRDEKKFGNTIYKELKTRGYDVVGVNPSMTEIGADRCYPNVSAIKNMADGIVVCISKERVEQVLREAAGIGLKHVWLQQGAETPSAQKLAGELGLSLISGKCILMYAEPVQSFHAFHRFFVRLSGRL